MADDFPTIQETVDEFRSLANQIQVQAQEVIDPQAVDFITTVVDQSQRLSQEQRNLVRSLGEEAVITTQITKFQERQVILSELQSGLSEQEHAAAERKLQIIDDQIERNDQLLRVLHEQVVSHGQALGIGKELTSEEEQLLDIQRQRAKLRAFANGFSEEEIELLDVQYQMEEKITQQRIERAKLTEKQQRDHSAQTKLLGFNMSEVKDKAKEFTGMAQSGVGILLAGAYALKSVMSKVVEDMQVIHNTGFGISQTWELTKQYAFDVGDYADRFSSSKIIAGPRAVQESVAGIAGAYGDISDLSQENVEQSLILTRALNMTADEAGMVLQSLEKVPGFTAGMSEDFVTTTRMLAETNRIAPQKIFAEIAQQSEDFAKYGAAGADAYARAVAAAAQMGVELSSITKFQDDVLNIDTFVQEITKLRTLGIGLEDPFRLAELSQAGDIEGFIDELQGQLRGIGRELTIEGLGGRTQANALADTFGMSLQELQRIMQGENILDPDLLDDSTKAELENSQRMENLGGSLLELKDSVDLSNIALTSLAAILALRGGLGMLGGFAGKGALTRMAVGGVRGVGAIGGAIGAGAGHLARGTVAAGRGAVNVGGRVASGLGTAARGVGAAGGAVGRGASAVAGMGRGIPVIGAAAGMGIDLARGEKMGRAGSAAAGAATGAALGSIVPGIGTAIGAIAGGIIGRVAGQKIYDAVTDVDLEPGSPPITPEEIIAQQDMVQRIDAEPVDRTETDIAPIMPGLNVQPTEETNHPDILSLATIVQQMQKDQIEPAPIMPGLNRQPTEEIDQTAIVSLATIVQQMQRDQEDRQEEKEKEIEIDLGGVEKRLDELTSMFETGKVAVVMDGRKVGRIMMNAYSRNVTA